MSASTSTTSTTSTSTSTSSMDTSTTNSSTSIITIITPPTNNITPPNITIPWETMPLRPLDDGHRPETTLHIPTRISEYPLFSSRPESSGVHVYADALPDEDLVDAAYDYTATSDAAGQPAWGDYVTIQQIKDYWKEQQQQQETNDNDNDNNNKSFSYENNNTLVVALAAHYLQLSLGEQNDQQQHQQQGATHPTKHSYFGKNTSDSCKSSSSPSPSPSPPSLWTRAELEDANDGAHGVAVWGLAAPIGSQVPYHLDYAEQLRYETNVIVAPLLAGTLHCTRDIIKGGDFLVWLDGIEHYERHGYKCKKLPLNDNETENETTTSMMHTVPYRFNQLICHLGNLPHASTRIEHIEKANTTSTSASAPAPAPTPTPTPTPTTQKRVIIGFNVFGHDVGPAVQEAPEHSERFRRKIQAQRALLRAKSKGSSNNKLSLERLKQNKPLSKLLVLAKRTKIKQDYQEAQRILAEEIPNYLPATVQQLMDRFYEYSQTQKWCWPASPTDVQVYLHHQLLQPNGRFSSVDNVNDPLVLPSNTTTATLDPPPQSSSSSSSGGLISPQVTIVLSSSLPLAASSIQ
jgi:hypothetical protein